MDIRGWVRNRRDGTVEAHAQGAPDAVERFVDWCRQGPPLARVSNVDATRGSRWIAALRDFAWRVDRLTARRRRCPSTPRIARRRSRATRARGRRPWSRCRQARGRTCRRRAPASAAALRANARSDDANARTHALAVEQRGHRHERERQRDEHCRSRRSPSRPTVGSVARRRTPGTRRLMPAMDHATALSTSVATSAAATTASLRRQRRRERHEEVLEARAARCGPRRGSPNSSPQSQERRQHVRHDAAPTIGSGPARWRSRSRPRP